MGVLLASRQQGFYALSVELSRMVRWDTSRSVVWTILYQRNYIPLLLQGGKGKVCNGFDNVLC